MSKSKSNRPNASNNSTASPRLSRTTLITPTRPIQVVRRLALDAYVLNQLDKRRYHPDPTHKVGATRRKYQRIVADPMRSLRSPLRFLAPPKVAICVRRKQRREVMHAKRLTRRGKSGYGKKQRNFWSMIKC